MYIPKHFAEQDTAILHTIIRENALATLVVSSHHQDISAYHLPLTLVTDENDQHKLVGHVARANPIWENTDIAKIHLAIFQGKNQYISPSWYPTKHEHGRAVPTWNYEVVYIKGHIQFIDDKSWLQWQINTLTDEHEAMISGLTGELPWRVSDAPNDFIDNLTQAIVGVEMTISTMTGKRKMSQNQPDRNKKGIMHALKQLNQTKPNQTKPNQTKQG